MDIADVKAETFAGREGERFWITFSDAELDLTLAEVSRAPEHWGRSELREPFSILFHATLDHVLPASTWPVEHDELGRLEMFLSPLGPDAEGQAMRYEAVFS